MNSQKLNTSFSEKSKNPDSHSKHQHSLPYFNLPEIDNGLRFITSSLSEVVHLNLPSSSIIKGKKVSPESVTRIAASSFIRFANRVVAPFVDIYKALPFDASSLMDSIENALQHAVKQYDPSRGTKFTTYLYLVVNNELMKRWNKEIRAAIRGGWFMTYPMEDIVERITERVRQREILLDTDFNPSHPPVKTTDIDKKDMKEIDRLYNHVFEKKKRHTCYMDYTPPKDFRTDIEENEAIHLILRAIVNDVSDKRRRDRRGYLAFVFLQLLSGESQSEIAEQLGKKESQISRWIADIVAISRPLLDAA